MAPLSVDDDYQGCSTEMLELVKSTYLPREKSGDFRIAWAKAESATQHSHPEKHGLNQLHAIAICVYSYERPNIYRPFNHAVRTSKNSYKVKFIYHSLHFLLTDAIQRLNNRHCMYTYRGTNLAFQQQSNIVRFGSFTSTSKSPYVATDFGKHSCFQIYTCHSASLSGYSDHLDEEEVLIPPYEQFQITHVINGQYIGPNNIMRCKVLYVLKSAGTSSSLRCSLVKRHTWFVHDELRYA